MSLTPIAPSEPVQWADTRSGRIIGLLLLCYGVFNTCLYVKFTPVYTATRCGDQTATLDKLELSSGSIRVGLNIEVTCLNPNPYSIDILTSEKGHVFVGERGGQRLGLGELRVLPGSVLPERGSGVVQVRMDAELSGETAHRLLPRFLQDREIPMMMSLDFNVGVSVNFGISTFETTAPFKKACGLNMAGLLRSGSNKLGPMKCTDDFANLVIPPVTDPTPLDGSMSFSAAQMDPERIQMGERMKNVSIINVMLACYLGGAMLLRTWFSEMCCNVRDNIIVRRFVQPEPEVKVVQRGPVGTFVTAMFNPFSTASRRYGYSGGKELLQVDAAALQPPMGTLESIMVFFNCRSSKRRPATTTIVKPEPAHHRTPRWGLLGNNV